MSVFGAGGLKWTAPTRLPSLSGGLLLMSNAGPWIMRLRVTMPDREIITGTRVKFMEQ